MKALYKELLDNSVAASLSAIEIYNKPDFKYRNEVFLILVINAWELLLKSKIVKDNNGKVNSLYIYDGSRIKKNRNNAPLTIDIFECLRKLKLNETLSSNLESLVEIRDSSIHFYNKENLNYIVYSLGVAALKNYQKSCNTWFKKDLLDYNFYILPLGFVYNFKTFSLLELKKEPETVKTLVQNLSNNQNKTPTDGFHFTCEIELKLTSAKKLTDKTDLSVAIDNEGKQGTVVMYKPQKLTDMYPLSWKELWSKISSALPKVNQSHFIKCMRVHKVRENKKYSSFNFRSRKDEELYQNKGIVKNGTPSIYNDECYRFLLIELAKG